MFHLTEPAKCPSKTLFLIKEIYQLKGFCCLFFVVTLPSQPHGASLNRIRCTGESQPSTQTITQVNTGHRTRESVLVGRRGSRCHRTQEGDCSLHFRFIPQSTLVVHWWTSSLGRENEPWFVAFADFRGINTHMWQIPSNRSLNSWFTIFLTIKQLSPLSSIQESLLLSLLFRDCSCLSPVCYDGHTGGIAHRYYVYIR